MHTLIERRTVRTAHFTPRVGTLLVAIAALAVGCSEPTVGPQSSSPRLAQSEVKAGHAELTSPFGPVFAFITDGLGMALSAASPMNTVVYGHAPAGSPIGTLGTKITAPDGSALTLGQFLMPKGTASLECVEGGTEAEIHVKGLVPNGQYTMWMLIFKAPGFDPTFANVIGLGALGPHDGSGNSFFATANGKGELETVVPPGRLSIGGPPPADFPIKYVGPCLLTSEFEVHLIAGYHYPTVVGKTLWPDPGPDEGFIEQFATAFIF